MIKKLLTFILFSISCLWIGIGTAKQKADIRVIVFDFNRVIGTTDMTQKEKFLLHSFDIDKRELSNALRDMKSFKLEGGGSEQQFWDQYALTKKVTLSNNWFDEYNETIKNCIIEIPVFFSS